MAKLDPIPAALSLDGLPGDARAGFDLAAAAGYGGIAIPTNHAELSPAQLGASAQRHLKKMLESKHLQIAALRAAAPRAGLMDPKTIDRTVSNVQKAVRLAGEMGVKTVSLFAGALGAADAPPGVISALRALSHEADRAGVTLAVGADSSEKLRSILEQIGFEGAAVNLLPAAAIGAGEDPLKIIETLGNHPHGIGALTAADAIRAGSHLRMVELGEGQVPWKELFSLLRQQGFTGPTVVDVRDLPDTPEAATQAAAVLRKLMARRE